MIFNCLWNFQPPSKKVLEYMFIFLKNMSMFFKKMNMYFPKHPHCF